MSGALGDPPIDPVTGEPFMLADKEDALEVTSERTGKDGKPAVRYEFRKQVPEMGAPRQRSP